MTLPLWIFLAAGLAASLSDIRTLTIPDLCSLGGLGALLVSDIITAPGRLNGDLTAAAAAGLLFTALRLATGHRLGIGDIKFSLLAGGATGPEKLPVAFLILGGVTLAASLLPRPGSGKGRVLPLAPLITLSFLLAAALPLSAREISEVNFENQEIRIIIRWFSRAGQTTIHCDETVNGTTSFHTGAGHWRELLEQFCRQNHLFLIDEGEMLTVSRIEIRSLGDNRYDCDAEEVLPVHLTERLGRDVGITILAEGLPQTRISLHVRNGTVEEILLLLIRRNPQFLLEPAEHGWFIRKRQGLEQPLPAGGLIHHEDGTYTIRFTQARARDLLTALFAAEGRELLFLTRNDPLLENITLNRKGFDEVLSLISLLGGLAWTDSGGILCLYDSGGQDILKRFLITRFYPVHNRICEEIPPLLPSGLVEGCVIRTDPATNTLIIQATPEQHRTLTEQIILLDLAPQEWVVPLVRLTGEELVKNPPRGISPRQFRQTGTPGLVLFQGTPEQYRGLLKELCRIDKPATQYRFQLLVVQYQEGDSLHWEPSVTGTFPEQGGENSLMGTLGGCLGLSFDVTTALGAVFAVELGAGIRQSRARVLADTSLTALSGQKVRFQNTGTTRYRDMERDPVTGEMKATGVTREITSGLFLEMTGTRDAGGSVLISLSATVSRQGTDTAGENGALPPTSEKIITTTLRARPGEPVSIGGLIQEERILSVDKVPLLGEIPLLGILFQKRRETLERTELVIYMIPTEILCPEDPCRRLFRRFFLEECP